MKEKRHPSILNQETFNVSSELLENEQHSERIKTLTKKLNKQRMRIKRLQRKHSNNFTSSKIEVKHIKEITSKYLNKDAHAFFCKQLDLSICKGKRWTARDKSYAVSLYHTSPKAYRMLQKQFFLPSVDTLRRVMRKIEIYPCFPKKLIEAFRLKVNSMEEKNKLCVLLFDEMSLKQSLNYNVERDYIEGLEDFGDLIDSPKDKPASSATVFMARGLIGQWKQPFGYALTSSAIKHADLKVLLMEAIKTLKGVGLKVKAVVCDQGPNNQMVLKTLGVTPEQPFFHHEDDKITVLFDPPHLIKSIRNNLINHDFYTADGVVSWSVILKFYEKDSALNSFRMAPKLTKKHIELSSFGRQRVCLAVQVLSHSVAKAIGTLCQLGINPPSDMATSEFCDTFDKLFNVFNGSLLSSAEYRNPIKPTSQHKEFLQKALLWLNNLKYGPEDKRKNARALPCVNGWIHNIIALQGLVNDIVNVEPGVEYLVTNRCNQDALENLFSIIRGKGGHHDNPEPQQFRYRLRQIMVDKILIASPSSNCKDDVDNFLINLASENRLVTVTISPDLDNEQRHIVNLVKSCNIQDIIHLENAISYVSGYILKRLYELVCKECIDKLEDSTSAPARHLTLIEQKRFKHCLHGGLKRPSFKLVEVVGLFEAVFQTNFKPLMNKPHIRQNLKAKMLQDPNLVQLKGNCCRCQTLEYLVNIFISIRLHHELNVRNEAIQQDRSRKNRKLMKLSHQ